MLGSLRVAPGRLIKAGLAVALFATAGLSAEHPIQQTLRQLAAHQYYTRARELKLADSAAWRRLIHYDSFLGSVRSEARDKTPGEFFASPKGEKDPEAELEATLLALFTDTSSPEPARCRYPAREIFLVRELKIDTTKLPVVDCKKYREWKEHLSADSASIVFASFFMGNPSSMFGHTFLRLHSTKRNALLDSSFNYAANAEEGNAIMYAWLGMTGGFPGTYAMHPYYVKINEYNDMESRDLWEFRLALTPAELEFLQAHLWELSSVYFPYYYLDENCSYQLLTALEAVRPSVTLTNRFSLFVTPTDTLHTLKENGFFTGEASYRAAVFTRYLAFFENSSGQARTIFDELREKRNLPAGRGKDETAAVDTLLEYYKYTNDYEVSQWKQADLVHYRELLAWRSNVTEDPGLEQFVVAEADKNPLNGFKSTEVRTGYYSAAPGGAIVAGIRPALREFQDVSLGLSPWSQMQIMGFSVSYTPAQNLLRLEEFNVVDLVALSPWRAHVRKLSYRLRTGLYRHDQFLPGGVSTLSWDSTAGAGFTLPLGKHAGFFLMAQATGQVGSVWENTLRIAPSAFTGLKTNWSARLNSVLSYEIDYGLVSNSVALQRVELRNAWAFWKTWVIEADLLYTFARPLGSSEDYWRASLFLKTYF
ncbi:MAG: DUF4105 domain-containing protein [Spirochaetota bacterium]